MSRIIFVLRLTMPYVAYGKKSESVPLFLFISSDAARVRSLIGSAVTTYYHPYYIAHALPAILIITVYGVIFWRRWTRSGFWRFAVYLIPIAQLLTILFFVGKQVAAPINDQTPRQRIEAQLTASPGRHLIVVEDECVYDSWIFLYNDANIDASRIVWARKLSGPEEVKLRKYYSDRAQWQLSLVDGKFVLRAFD